MGPEVIAGMKFKGAHVVVSMQSLKQRGFEKKILLSQMGSGKRSFPLATACKTEDANPHHALPEPEGFTPPEEELPSGPPVPETPGGTQTRNPAITKLRIAVHGKTPKCIGCIEGSYNHNKECRNRFNELLDFHEPVQPSSTREKVLTELEAEEDGTRRIVDAG